jgi:hypothetical protein
MMKSLLHQWEEATVAGSTRSTSKLRQAGDEFNRQAWVGLVEEVENWAPGG